MGGVSGLLITFTLVFPLVAGQPPGMLVTVTLYVPLFTVAAPGITGF